MAAEEVAAGPSKEEGRYQTLWKIAKKSRVSSRSRNTESRVVNLEAENTKSEISEVA